MSNYIVSDTSLGSVADAIRTKGGTSAPLEYPQGFIDAIGDIQTGGGTPTIQALTVTENGTYTASSGVDGYSPVTVNVSGGGDTPIPDDGKTRIFIYIAEGTPDNRSSFTLRFTASEANNTTVDWGDGTTEIKGSTTATNYSHKYAEGGNYVITMTVNSGTIAFKGDASNSIYGTNSSNNYYNRSRITRIAFGNHVDDIGIYVFHSCYSLVSVTLPNGLTSIGDFAFYNCYSLTNIEIPNSVTSIGASAFYGCYNLASVLLSDNVSTLGNSAFRYCHTLTSIIIPATVTDISARALADCYGFSEIHFYPTTPPTLANTNAFNGIQSDCKIYVPYSADHSILDAYKTATNWSSYASKIQEEPT